MILTFPYQLSPILQEQNRPARKFLEARTNWRETESLGGGLLSCHGRPLFIYRRLLAPLGNTIIWRNLCPSRILFVNVLLQQKIKVFSCCDKQSLFSYHQALGGGP